jgi:hypothetical protein
MIACRSGTRVRMHDVWVLWEEHGMVHRLLTGGTVRGCLTYDTVAYESGTWVRMYDVLVLWEEHNMVHILLTGRIVRVFQARANIKVR